MPRAQAVFPVALVSLICATASAQSPSTPPAGSANGRAGARLPERTAAEVIGDTARARAREGDCAGALKLFDQALQSSTDLTLDRGIMVRLYRDRAMCHEKLGQPYPAIEDYRAYLTRQPDAADADEVRARMARLQDDVAARATRGAAEVALRVGYATPPFPLPGNPLGAGAGAQMGASLSDVYFGVSGMFYFGGPIRNEGDGQLPQYGILPGGVSSMRSLLLGGDVGYNFHLRFWSIRPEIGFGDFTLLTNDSTFGVHTASYFYLEPGVTAQTALGVWLLGVDANGLLLPGVPSEGAPPGWWPAFTLHARVGLRF